MTHAENNRATHVRKGETDPIEKPDLTLGFMPLTDCAPLVVALEQGYFAEQGLHVTLAREVSWANIRDKVGAGLLDGAQMLAPMPMAASLPNQGAGVPMITALSLGLNGNTVGVSIGLHAALSALELDSAASSGARLAAMARQRRDQGHPLRLGMVFPWSTHNYLLRYWLAAHGLHPDRDLRLEVVPPPFMVEALATGDIEGYCVGEHWGSLAVERGVSVTLLADHGIWNHHPEKVFAVTEDWSERHPATHRALLVALLKAAEWLDQPNHRAAFAGVLAREEYVRVPVDIIRQSLLGEPPLGRNLPTTRFEDFNIFFRHAATFPWRSHALWFLTQMARWGQIDAPIPLRPLAERVYRTDLYREAAAALGLACPTMDEKEEGRYVAAHAFEAATRPLTLGADRFCDGRTFDPRRPIDYLAQCGPHSLRGDIDAWRQVNR